MWTCVFCEHRVDELFKVFPATVSLGTCERCGKVADPYVEYPWIIVFLDLLLLKQQVFRHLLNNTSSSLIVLLRNFSILVLVQCFVTVVSSQVALSGSDLFQSALFFALKCGLHVAVVFIVVRIFVGLREGAWLGSVVNAFLVGSILPKSVLALVWEYSHLLWTPLILDVVLVLSRGLALGCVAKMGMDGCVLLSLGLFIVLDV